tara:strand:+ start:203 stop:610 length:408 start_codon:yes stop_codon:yes gene_type:complete
MAVEIFTGQINPGDSVTYNNNTGGNVRVVINYLYCGNDSGGGGGMDIEFGTSGNVNTKTGFGLRKYQSFGKSLGWASPSQSNSSANAGQNALTQGQTMAGPTEVYLKNGDFFEIRTNSGYPSSSEFKYQYLVIPE